MKMVSLPFSDFCPPFSVKDWWQRLMAPWKDWSLVSYLLTLLVNCPTVYQHNWLFRLIHFRGTKTLPVWILHDAHAVSTCIPVQGNQVSPSMLTGFSHLMKETRSLIYIQLKKLGCIQKMRKPSKFSAGFICSCFSGMFDALMMWMHASSIPQLSNTESCGKL